MYKGKIIWCVFAGVAVAIVITAKVMKNKANRTTYKANGLRVL